ncbi:MAG TPA: ABC transporter ATP-binding protein [Candidatus Acidoferrales bacterium]|nr:ABC transporter ATP-binding protein [Candidatus Acidoferrales bacterium]
MNRVNVITVQQVTKKFPSVVALDKITLEINEQEFFGLLGPNGAGKTTLMSLLAGYLSADEGTIVVSDQVISQANLELKKEIGFVPQSIALYDELSAQDNLEMFGGLYDVESGILTERIREKLNAVGLYERRKDKVKTFSGGMKRRLNIIASLLHDPRILLCDEPTVGVDPQSRNAIFDYLETLNRQGKTIIYTTHYMEEAERLCSRIAIIDHGTIIAIGTTDELLEKLPYDETIVIAKNPSTLKHLELFHEFGELLEEDDHFELKPTNGFTLSRFFAKVEEKGLKYSWIELHRPTLEALFLQLTGRSLRD